MNRLSGLRSRLRKAEFLWASLGALGGAFVFVVAVVVTGAVRGGAQDVTPPTPMVTVIANPTATPTSPPAPSATAMPLPADTPTPDPSAGTGFGTGDRVEVSGTGGDGLRVRGEAGLSAAVRFMAWENEVFEVQAGPREADGHSWWYLVSLLDAAKSGWAVGDYLRPLGTP